jgi:hypothetical protein
LDSDFSIKGEFEGSSSTRDFTDGENTVKPVMVVHNSGTSEGTDCGGEQSVDCECKSVGRNWSDDRYIVDKLHRHGVRLFEELWSGKTRLARDFSALYSIRPLRARDLVGQAVTARNPSAWLNVAVGQEFSFDRKERAQRSKVVA